VTALSLRGLTVRVSGRLLLDGVNLDVEPGAVAGLLGPNGAGKTTLLDAVTGFVPARGQVLVEGVEVGGRPPRDRARAGLARSFQGLELFEDLSVLDNLRVAAPSERAADEALESVGLSSLAGALPRDLPRGDRALVAVARGLAARPRVLLLDEPAAGADAQQRRRLGALLRQVASAGTAVVLVDHDTDLVLASCDVAHVLVEGRLLASGPPEQVRSDPEVRAAYLGEGRRPPRTVTAAPAADPALVVDGLTAAYGDITALRSASLRAAPGEVVAVLGRNGAGKTTLLRAVAGLHRPAGGRLELLGAGWQRAPGPARRGLALVPQERGLLPRLTGRENLRLATRRRPVDEVLGRLPDLPPLLERRVGQLSGGQQQQLALARALLTAPRVLMVDELSLGLAPLVVDALLPLLREAADRDGAAVVLVEQHAALALSVADRVVVLDRGEVALEASPAELTAAPERLDAAYLGRA
jgi:branched-chain amino acid transport system ATP-binding protein